MIQPLASRPEPPAQPPVRRPRRNSLPGRIFPALAPAALALAVWELAVRLFAVPEYLLPGPLSVAQALWESRALLAHHAVPTASEALLGFAGAFVCGTAFGFLVSRSGLAERALYPWLVASQALPIIAIAPVLVTWFGYGALPKVLVVILFCFFPITVGTVDGLRSVDGDLLRLMRSFGASRTRTFLSVEVPAALPFLFGGIRLSVTYCVIGAVTGEWVGSSEGLGFLMIQDKNQFEIPRLFAEIAILSAMGVALFLSVALVQRLFAPWTLERRQ
ncbi:ABC-type nitrate/sulfonate/bicarbonate transport system permease component [Rubrobacter radiotolerans]|uniref:ABC transporter permease n=1 Tax=Rubrobacter radiotolerans TaxID=42256 RepID=A0A023X5V0_RUBRA|nr:ABC transporter permease [Rubrobacter radiotolerans]AHY47718.1 ABC-type nitrate/sulfonate/bicarbonate transport system permease component [Rubrobacter radiotolerans]MDX5895121.1 ABC transporter permease [Rubrobacter radiotolerans]SMC07496.1 ABC-type nitrate/sulfonate/bicarbonate transport system, permease component [Rubrobacter radiotolerans DSM 5868]